MGKVFRRRTLALALLWLVPSSAKAEDRTVLLARFFDGMRSENYAQAVTNFLPIMLAPRQPQTKLGRDCIAALKAIEAAAADAACSAFALESPTDAQAPLSLGLAKLLTKDPDEASRLFFKAAKITPPFEPALFITLFGQPNSSHGLTALDRIHIPSGEQGTLDQAFLDFRQGDFAAAARGFQRIYDAGASTGTVPLMLFVAQKHSGIAPTVALADDPTADAGYRMLMQALRGDKPAKESLREYRVNWGEYDTDYPRNRFFLGEAALIHGDKAEAIRFFKKAVAAAKLGQTESELAAAELARLEKQ